MKEPQEINTESIRFHDHTFVLGKTFTREYVNQALHSFDKWQKQRATDTLVFDLTALKELDSAGAVTLHFFRTELKKSGVDAEFEHATGQVSQMLKLFEPIAVKKKSEDETPGFFERIGQKVTYVFKNHVFNYFKMTADIFYWTFTDWLKPKQSRKGEVIKQAVHVGVNAVPIVVGMSFIIGLVLALQSASQLRNFGADVYIVDLIVISMMSEMGPLITAILVAGRSGSAIAAEIATMKVTSELDALKTMGINPIRFVVIPKMYGSLLTMPFLTVLASVAGIIGGLTTAYFYLDVTPEIFFNRMADVLYNKDIITGIVKSIVFAALIVVTGSYYGLLVDRGAEGVGLVTTKSVVASISLVIVADSIMSLVFY